MTATSSIYFMLAIVCAGCSARIVLVGQESGDNAGPPTRDGPTGGNDDTVDLHGNKPYCTDVSTWGDVEYIGKLREKCNTTFIKEPHHMKKKVCDNVTEIACDIVPYTTCVLTMENVSIKDYQDKPEIYMPWVCEKVPTTIIHTKQIPECKNVTKLNCVTLWELDKEGKQVWAGNEDCEPVTWRQCVLKDIKVPYVIEEVKCTRRGEIRWDDCEEIKGTAMSTKMTCDVSHAKDCNATTYEKCKEIEYTEWIERKNETCENVTILMPNQTWEHKKKCLLPEGGGNGLAHHGHHDHHEDHHDDHTEQTTIDAKEEVNLREGKLVQPIQGRESRNQQSLLRNIPSHPSIDGFQLNGRASRNGKAMTMKSESLEVSKSEVINVGKRPTLNERETGQRRILSVPAARYFNNFKNLRGLVEK